MDPDLIIPLTLLGGVGVIPWVAYKIGEYMSSCEPVLISKRCQGCQNSPMPKDMEYFFGLDWRDQTRCLKCRGFGFLVKDNPTSVTGSSLPRYPTGYYNSGSSKTFEETWVGFIPKFAGLAPDQIKEWYLTQPVRDKLRVTWRKQGTMVYISDGLRFWKWTDFPWSMKNFLQWDDFLRREPDWEVLELPGISTEDLVPVKSVS